MLAEALEHLLTPCPAPARRMGLLRESVAIGARHRRCREAWRPHLERCRAHILQAADACQGGGTALVLGSGRLLDIPLEELAARFRRVVLADAVHPLNVRWRARSLPGVRLDAVDLTGTWQEVLQGRLPRPADPALYRDLSPDLTVSANCLSQLPLAPLARLEAAGRYDADELEAFHRAVLAAHLDWLRTLPGVRLLLTDTAWPPGPRGDDPLPGLQLPPPLDAWDWTVAPRPEIHADRDVTHRVAAFLLRG
ncbi:hypothetical protein NNJEOMEG_02728 [Fundidesulfovibrio magnetotacticus]|uniref:Class I SAM-dependent methyltransferase n=1 Tax=Fundidesulfovibrio magnetotacticus TaxID=2730080 RepID=A0A6V8LVA3_9BACT|nr:hypothetical protein [Fundidesulfovibrio magnetotacticus]GFK94880.1 hypothetical protein NNJEOMEG_02728 [Fundidesulfovibrio magnetotacticus]